MPLSACDSRRPLVPALIWYVPPLWITCPVDEPATCPACTARPMREPLLDEIWMLLPAPTLSVATPGRVDPALAGLPTMTSLTDCALETLAVKGPLMSATSAVPGTWRVA